MGLYPYKSSTFDNVLIFFCIHRDMLKNHVGEVLKCTHCNLEKRIVIQQAVKNIQGDQSISEKLLCKDCMDLLTKSQQFEI
jgi:hypothetical protein